MSTSSSDSPGERPIERFYDDQGGHTHDWPVFQYLGAPMSNIMFAPLSEFGVPYCLSDDPKMQSLGNWITTDISVHKGVCLDALAIIADSQTGGDLTESWDSDNYTVLFSSSGMNFQNKWIESDHGEFAIAEVREAVEDYWRFLANIPDNPELIREFRPDLPEWQAALLLWEQAWKRAHPYRGRLF